MEVTTYAEALQLAREIAEKDGIGYAASFINDGKPGWGDRIHQDLQQEQQQARRAEIEARMALETVTVIRPTLVGYTVYRAYANDPTEPISRMHGRTSLQEAKYAAIDLWGSRRPVILEN